MSTGCMVNLNANTSSAVEVCGNPAPYRMWIDGCVACRQIDYGDCAGHPACLAHTAAMRAGSDLRDRGKLTKITRISGARETMEENDG